MKFTSWRCMVVLFPLDSMIAAYRSWATLAFCLGSHSQRRYTSTFVPYLRHSCMRSVRLIRIESSVNLEYYVISGEHIIHLIVFLYQHSSLPVIFQLSWPSNKALVLLPCDFYLRVTNKNGIRCLNRQ